MLKIEFSSHDDAIDWLDAISCGNVTGRSWTGTIGAGDDDCGSNVEDIFAWAECECGALTYEVLF